MADLHRKLLARLAGILSEQAASMDHPRADTEGVAAVLLALGDGFAPQFLANRPRRRLPSFDVGVATARPLLGG